MTREDLFEVIETLSPQSIHELAQFVDYLKFKEMQPTQQATGSSWLKDIYAIFAPVRAEVAASGMTEDEINQLIEEAIDEVRL